MAPQTENNYYDIKREDVGGDSFAYQFTTQNKWIYVVGIEPNTYDNFLANCSTLKDIAWALVFVR